MPYDLPADDLVYHEFNMLFCKEHKAVRFVNQKYRDSSNVVDDNERQRNTDLILE